MNILPQNNNHVRIQGIQKLACFGNKRHTSGVYVHIF